MKVVLQIIGIILLAILIFGLIPAYFLGLGWLVQLLWNELLAANTGIGEISYWLAVGLAFVISVVFGGGARATR